jgi:RND family efflux transporter MFP subunit
MSHMLYPRSIAAAFSARDAGFAPRAMRGLGLVTMLVAAGLVVSGCSDAQGEAAAAPPAPEVTVASPLTRSVNVYDEVVGRFEAVQAVEIRAQVSGRLAKVHFEDGQTVRAGDVLFTIDPAPFAAAAAEAEAELARAQALGALAQDESRRAETLVGHDAISQEEYDRRIRAAEEAAASLRAAQAQLEATRIDLGYTTITAPVDGRISDRRIDAGNLVAAGESLLTTVVSENPIYADFAVTPEVASALGRPTGDNATDATVQIRLEGETEFAHAGRIDFVDNRVDPQSGLVRMRAVVDNPEGRFAPGQFVRVRFARSRVENAVLVPEMAVSSDQNAKYVLVVNADNIVEPRPIGAGPVVDGMRIVETGLGSEDRVIVGGAQRAYPGTQVTSTSTEIEFASR